MGDAGDRERLLRWLSKARRFRAETISRWGHIYEEALADGAVSELPPEVYMNGRYRDIRTPVVAPRSQP